MPIRIIARILIFFAVLELLLRCSGLATIFFQKFTNHLSLKKSGHYTVLFVGDSISLGDPSYSSMVERLVNERLAGTARVQTVNQSMALISTEYILDNLPQWMDEFKPAIVVAMTAGINDEARYGRAKDKDIPILGHLRSVRLMKKLWDQAILIARERGVISRELESKSTLSYQPLSVPHEEIKKAILLFRVGVYFMGHNREEDARQIFAQLSAPDQKPYVRTFIEAMQTALYLIDTGQQEKAEDYLSQLRAMDLGPDANVFIEDQIALTLWGRQLWKRWLVHASTRLDKNPYDGSVTIRLDRMCQKRIIIGDVNVMLQDLIKKYPDNPRYFDLYSSCAYYQRDTAVTEALRTKTTDLRKGLSGETQDNLRKIHKLVTGKGVTLVLVQYPRVDIERLKDVFSGNTDTRGLYFVENKKNFEKALAANGYGYVFSDQCCGNYGHATDYGKSMMAEEVTKTILDILKK